MVITSAPYSLTQSLAALVSCKPVQFPIRYLGLPLSDKRLCKADYSQIIDRLQAVLTGWKASFLSIGGRIILTNAVISTIPQYLMSVFMLPKWLLHKIDQIIKRFVWHGHREQQRQIKGLYMVNWRLATRPRELGGLGLRDIQLANHALLIKWMWNWNTADNAWWKQVTVMKDESDAPWNDPNGSPFWRDLKKVAAGFECSIAYQIGNGKKAKFWHDGWIGKPLKYVFPDLYHLAQDKHCSVRQCITDHTWRVSLPMLQTSLLVQRDHLLSHLPDIQISQAQDQIRWIRGSTHFTVSSVYNFLIQTPSPQSTISNLWQIKAPLRVTVFAWLMLNGRLTTADNLLRRGWHLPSICAMCMAAEETTHHLFHNCSAAIEIREYVYSTFATQYSIPPKYCIRPSNDLLINSAEVMTARQLEIVTCFVLWRERCRRIFSEKSQSRLSLVREIKLEHGAWFDSKR